MTCVWEPDPGCLGDDWTGLDEDIKERSLMLATSSLQALTFHRVGTCPITIRPLPDAPPCGCSVFNPHLGPDGRWFNNCHHRSQYGPRSEVDIPGPVGFIDSLKIDGQEIDLYDGNWRLDNGHLLVWQGSGESPIPTYQNLNLGDDQPGTWSITYSRSYPVAADARIAVAYLAKEFAEACKPRGKCSLPKGVTNVVRNGVSFSIEAGLFTNGLTGIELTDQFILKWAPAGMPARTAQVFDPRKMAPRVSSAVPARRVPPPSGGSS